MDETTLTTTLRSLASEPALHTAPSADARSRARRLQRGRRTGVAAGALSLLAVAGLVAGQYGGGADAGQPVGDATWTQNLEDPTQPNHATTGFVTVPRAAGGQYAVYWQHDHLCVAFTTSSEPGSGGGSGCSSVTPEATQPMTLANVGGEDAVVAVSVAPGVAKVVVHRPDGTSHSTVPVSAAGFPYRVVVVTGKTTELRAFDGGGHALGAAVAGPDAAQLRPVLATFACPLTGGSDFDIVLPALDDASRCYGLAATAMTLTPNSAQAVDDHTQGWVVAVTLSSQDQRTFADLTGRLAGQPAPRNQLAIVFEGKVFEAPAIDQSITGGSLQISGGAKPFTEREAKQLAQMIGG